MKVLLFEEMAAVVGMEESDLRASLTEVFARFPSAEGIFVHEVQMMDRLAGQKTMVVYGPGQTFKEVPTGHLSLTGSVTAMGSVIGVFPRGG
jgi:hypothetical protein